MKIKGIENISSLPSIGELRKGAPKQQNRSGDDLKHFRFTSIGNADKDLERIFYETYGKEPNFLTVYLPSDDLDEIFFGFCEEYTQGGVVHFCDTEKIWERNRITGKWHETNKWCPYAEQNPKRVERPKDKYGKELGCQPKGRLSVILRDLTINAKRFGVVRVLTSSINDIRNLSSAIRSFQENFGSVKGVPFTLYRSPRSLSIPMGDKKGRTEKWLLFIEPDASFASTRLEASQHKMIEYVPQAIDPQLEKAKSEIESIAQTLMSFKSGGKVFYDIPQDIESARRTYSDLRSLLRNLVLDMADMRGHDKESLPTAVEEMQVYLQEVTKGLKDEQ